VKTYNKAIEAYTNLLKLYPDDSIAGTNLGILYMGLKEWDKAFFPYVNQSEAYRAPGMCDKARGSVKGMKRLDAAQKTAAELKKLIDEGLNKKEIRLYEHLLGMIELKKRIFPGRLNI